MNYEIHVNGKHIADRDSKSKAVGHAMKFVKNQKNHMVGVVFYEKGKGYTTIAFWEFGTRVK